MSCRKGDRKVEVGKGEKKRGGCRKEEEGVRKVEKVKREKKNRKEKKTFSIICFANFV